MAKVNPGKENLKSQPTKYDVLHKWYSKASPFPRTSTLSQLQAVPPELAVPGLHPAFGKFSTRKYQQSCTLGARTPLSEIRMPYNNAAIPPTEEEMFIRYLAEQAMNVVKSERKPRRNIQYKDLAGAVSRIDNLEFLADVIPKTTTYREYKEKKARTARPHARLSSGQLTLDNSRPLPSRPADVLNSAETQASRSHVSPGESVHEETHDKTRIQTYAKDREVVFEHYEPNGISGREESEDVEMG
ncbi:MAG: hypothetical protein LQ345_004516 [Seirophora villosa]|nr:MAG: hypothetical protein LQ345_004516 [Seirophora villosa]